ncbi:MAG: hypothetical protein R3B52_00500 [Candidatus Paceibacterota bacterium]
MLGKEARMRIYFILASLALALTLTACGGGSAGSGTPVPIDVHATQVASVLNMDSMGREIYAFPVRDPDGSFLTTGGVGVGGVGVQVGYVGKVWNRDIVEKNLPPEGGWIQIGAEFQDGEVIWSEDVWFVPGQPHLQMEVDGLRKPAFQEIEE